MLPLLAACSMGFGTEATSLSSTPCLRRGPMVAHTPRGSSTNTRVPYQRSRRSGRAPVRSWAAHVALGGAPPPTTRPSHHAAACRAQQLLAKQAVPNAHHCFASPLLLSMKVFARQMSQGDNGGTCFRFVTSITFFAFIPGVSPQSICLR